ncbi:DNA repair protein RecO [Candidatus Poribacteria bacterium]|nr:DNA repair protein RecO [Candidatus Poribacteria bacterium]
MEKTEAVVLHTYNLTESSKIVVLLTPYRGKVRAVAKGVRRTKSKFGSALEPITHVEAEIYFKDGRDLQNLSQAETLDAFPSIRSDLTRLGLASLICELMEQFAQEDEDSSALFALLLIALKTLASTTKNYASLLISFYLRLLDVSGLLPEINHCVRCRRGIEGHAYLEASAGGALCGGCSGGAGEKVYAGSLKIMQRLLTCDWTMLDRTRIAQPSADEILRALNTYIIHHTGRELRSARFLRSLPKLDRE